MRIFTKTLHIHFVAYDLQRKFLTFFMCVYIHMSQLVKYLRPGLAENGVALMMTYYRSPFLFSQKIKMEVNVQVMRVTITDTCSCEQSE